MIETYMNRLERDQEARRDRQRREIAMTCVTPGFVLWWKRWFSGACWHARFSSPRANADPCGNPRLIGARAPVRAIRRPDGRQPVEGPLGTNDAPPVRVLL